MNRSAEGDGLTVSGEARRVRRSEAGARGLPEELPDEPAHLPLDADRVIRAGAGRSGEDVRGRPHTMPCDRPRTGHTPFHDHGGAGGGGQRS
ncbi:hypothetical protein ACGFYA_27480 [Streptomyces sp. NPDC048305]|uniref:hypothetical protein n=1 Tax=Streptomyces sp. NPDC048305 TaxID=3365532 RepID=UPI0037235597